MRRDVEERLAHGAGDLVVRRAGQRHGSALHPQGDVEAAVVVSAHLVDELGQRRDGVAVRLVQGVDGPPQLLDRLLGQVAGGEQLVVDGGGDRPEQLGLSPGHLDGQPRRQDVLGDAVVQLTGDAVALAVDQLALGRHVQLLLGPPQLGRAAGEVLGLGRRLVVELLRAPVQREPRLVLLRGVQRDRCLVGEDAQHRHIARLRLLGQAVQDAQRADRLALQGHRHPDPARWRDGPGQAGADGAQLAAHVGREVALVALDLTRGGDHDEPGTRPR